MKTVIHCPCVLVSCLLAVSILNAQTSADRPRPIIDNDRVTVSLLDPAAALRGDELHDVVVVYTAPTPGAVYVAKKSVSGVAGHRGIAITLKDYSQPPLANTSGYPNAFPRPGKNVKLFENDKVIVWDYTWTPGQPTPMHFHDKDVVVIYLETGALESTTADGQATMNEFTAGDVRFNTRNRVHTERLVRGSARAIITELK